MNENLSGSEPHKVWGATCASCLGTMTTIAANVHSLMAIAGLLISAVAGLYAIRVSRATLKVQRWEEETAKLRLAEEQTRLCRMCHGEMEECPYTSADRPEGCQAKAKPATPPPEPPPEPQE